MTLLERLSKNKGTLSSALSKRLARDVLAGDHQLLGEAVRLTTWRMEEPDFRHVRSGAAKIVEETAHARPELVKGYLPVLMKALEVGEPQTRWMTIRTFGFCASLDPRTARRALPFAERFVSGGSKLCLKSSADRYLGDIGALSAKDAAVAFPILEKSIENLVENEQDWIMEALLAMAHALNEQQRGKAEAFAKTYRSASRKSTRLRAAQVLEAMKG